jgi:hypothetical protein
MKKILIVGMLVFLALSVVSVAYESEWSGHEMIPVMHGMNGMMQYEPMKHTDNWNEDEHEEYCEEMMEIYCH